ncbi:MAG: Maf family protein [Defluviitaleaceae bacterium]|nr:Maf family protein [Defluviitaleaceae bacterium]
MIILASESPRRRELLRMAGFDFTVKPANIDEDSEQTTDPTELVQILSRKKALFVRDGLTEPNFSDAVVIGADTVVHIGGEILGKPADQQAAFAMLSRLQGNMHVVHTGVTVAKGGYISTFVESTKVFMAKLTDRQIWDYIATGEPFDKAGSYAIQNKGALLVERIDGDFYTVVGLPLCRLGAVLAEFA